MNQPKLPYLRNLTNVNRPMSRSINSKSTHSVSSSSVSSNKSKESNPLPVLIQLCLHPDENHAYRTMRLLLSARYHYSPNVCDEFGCNVLMYSLRYQRYRLLELLLTDISLDLNLHARDRDGNTILHYAIFYGGKDPRIIEKLIEKYQKFGIQIDERNNFGFTPLLLAAFCGRYDFVFTFLTKTEASPFVRDYIQLKNMFDYIEIDLKQTEYQKSQQFSPETKRLRQQLHQTIPSGRKTSISKNFFEIFFLRSLQDPSGLYRSLILHFFHLQDLTNLLNYLNQRYPRIQTSRRLKDIPTTKFLIQKENSKIDLHHIFNLFDPELKPKAIPPPSLPQILTITKTPMTFKRLGTKITTLSAFSKTQVGKKRPSLLTTRIK